jgi:mono/diheme cytochrome c family protein
MVMQRIGFGVATLISVAVAGLFAGCGGGTEDTPPPATTMPVGTGTGSAPVMSTTAPTTPMPTMTAPMPTMTTPMPTMTTPMPTMTAPMPTMTAPMPTMTAPMPTMTAEPMPMGDPVAGKQQYASSSCVACHGATAGGSIGPNISGDMAAGIGGWTYEEFVASVREGLNPDGTELCLGMTRYSTTMLSDEGMLNIYAYLMTEMNAEENRGSSCP